MAKNQRHPNGIHISVPVPDGVKSGEPVQIGLIRGVAIIDKVTKTGEATVWLDGSWDIPVAGAVASVGDPVYIKADRSLTATATGNAFWGVSLATKGTGTAPLEVRPIGYATPTATAGA